MVNVVKAESRMEKTERGGWNWLKAQYKKRE